jgi:hypothetical protein
MLPIQSDQAPAKGAKDRSALSARLPAYLLCMLTPLVAGAIEIPAGTALPVRQQVAIGSSSSRIGDPVSAVLLADIVVDGLTVLTAGSELDGRVATVRRTGLGFKRQTSSLTLDFHTIRPVHGETLAIDARVRHIETAREWVDSEGRIHGIRPVTNVSSSLAVAAWRLLAIAPGVGVPVWATKLIFAPAPDTEIRFQRGTEYCLELARPLRVEPHSSSTGLPTRLLTEESRTEFQALLDELPSQRANRASGEPSDLVNLILIGRRSAVANALRAAGWATSDRKATGSVLRSYFSIVLRRGYEKAPMATLLLDGKKPDIEFQKSLNTFAKRHHVRIWQTPYAASGDSVWAATATEDTGVKFSKRIRNFTHTIDGYVDAERTKVVNDLLYTGCVSEAGLVERDAVPADLRNGTGTKIETDGRVAVLRIGECDEPRVMPGVGSSEHRSFLRRLQFSWRTELIRSNFISLVYNGVRLTSAALPSLFGRPSHNDTGVTLTRQQVSWLAVRPRK